MSELSGETVQFLDKRLELRRLFRVSYTLADLTALPQYPYWKQAKEEADPDGYPGTANMTQAVLDLYRSKKGNTDSVGSSVRQINLLEGFRKSLLSRRQRRTHMLAHQMADNENIEDNDRLARLALLGPKQVRQVLRG